MTTGEFDGETVVDIIKAQAQPTIEKIIYQMSAFVDESKNLSAILYVGGGSAFMGKELSEIYGGNSILPENPSMANARGILKYINAFGE